MFIKLLPYFTVFVCNKCTILSNLRTVNSMMMFTNPFFL